MFYLLKQSENITTNASHKKIASPENSFGIGNVQSWFFNVAWPTESVETNQQTPVCRFFSINSLRPSDAYMRQ